MLRTLTIASPNHGRIDVTHQVEQIAMRSSRPRHEREYDAPHLEAMARKVIAAAGLGGPAAVLALLPDVVGADYRTFLAGVWERVVRQESDPSLDFCPDDALP
jgi:hypothetical protein